MATSTKNIYFVVKDRNGDGYLCPFNTVKDRSVRTDDGLDSCVERDVAERYSGNITTVN